MFFVALESRNSRAYSLSRVQRNGTMLLSGHSRGHIYLFYGAKCTGAHSNIPDACCTVFYRPNTNGILLTAPQKQPERSLVFAPVPEPLHFIFIFAFNNLKDILTLLVPGCSLSSLDAALSID